jgi:WD40 repeat protein
MDKSIQIYSIDKKQIIRTISLNHWCSCLDLSNIKMTNHLIAIGTNERLIQLKDYTQETFQDFIGFSDRITNIKFNKSNNLLITTSANEIFVWKIVLN